MHSHSHLALCEVISRLSRTAATVSTIFKEEEPLKRLKANPIEEALNHIPPHDEEADHCLNLAFYNAAQYMIKAGNPVGRRVIIVITGVTSNFDCDGPSGNAAMNEVFESGSVVCGLIPSSSEQRMESGIMRTATSIGGIFKAPSLRINKLAEETGGEVLDDKPENLDRAFNTLI